MKLEMRTLKNIAAAAMTLAVVFWCCISQARYCKRS